MDQAIKEKWVKALRSGEYRQGKDNLCSSRSPTDRSRFCCLGVLCKIQDAAFTDCLKFPEMAVSTVPESYAAGLSEKEQQYLAAMNDGGSSFGRIADYIEESY